MTESEFMRLAGSHGFSPEQAEFMLNTLSLKPHTHTADQILDFDESVSQIIEDDGDEDGEDL